MDKISDLKEIVINTLDLNKAQDIVTIDLKDKSSMADYMIIASGTSSRHIQSLSEQVLEKINKEYVDEFNQSESMDSAINGLLQSLDPYSSYMSPKIFDEMQTETSGEFGGLGIEVSMEAGVGKEISPIDDTPASMMFRFKENH